MTYREYYAGLAMQGLCARGGYSIFSALAYDANEIAKAMCDEFGMDPEGSIIHEVHAVTEEG